MTTSIIFDFDTFYKYYTNKRNVNISTEPLTLKYYDDFTIKKINKSGNYIIINGNNLYIDILPKNQSKGRIKNALLFTTPTPINGELWDTHYHFGVRSNFSKSSRGIRNINAVYFHKTTQTPTGKKLSNCYFLTNQDITNIENIECLESGSGSRISDNDKFPMSGLDFSIIREIIHRPFLGIRFGGKSIYTRRYKQRKTRTRKHRKM
jgi:hypothetical protein